MVNLAPADLRKEGPAYYVPIAVTTVGALQHIWVDTLADSLFVGEQSLDSSTCHWKGILPPNYNCPENGYMCVFAPSAYACEAALLPNTKVLPVENLSEPVGHLTGLTPI